MSADAASAPLVTCDVGPVAAGGHCVARDQGQVIFVRHALPGERVTARITSQGRGFLRADAVEVLSASPDRVAAPCPYAGPGGCGGCDFQHGSAEAQRDLKAAVIREQLARLAGITDLPVRVDPLPGGLTGWRTRMRYTADSDGRLGLKRHRSHQVIPVERCLIAHPDVATPATGTPPWPPGTTVDMVRGDRGAPVVLAGPAARTARPRRPSDSPTVVQQVAGRDFVVAADGFWQIHPDAARTLSEAVVEALAAEPGDRVWDLYGGAGLFAAALAGEVGPTGRVTVVESDPRSVDAARRALADLAQVAVVRAPVATALANPRWKRVDRVVVDPPRTGLGGAVVRRIAARRPRAIAYVSCDPATFARDVALFRTEGYDLVRLTACDAFPMTQHVEVVGELIRPRT